MTSHSFVLFDDPLLDAGLHSPGQGVQSLTPQPPQPDTEATAKAKPQMLILCGTPDGIRNEYGYGWRRLLRPSMVAPISLSRT